MSPLQARSIGAYDEAAAFPLPDDRAHPARIVPPALLADLLSTGHLATAKELVRWTSASTPDRARLFQALVDDDPEAVDAIDLPRPVATTRLLDLLRALGVDATTGDGRVTRLTDDAVRRLSHGVPESNAQYDPRGEPVPGGLADPTIFGPVDDPASANRCGHLELHEPFVHPGRLPEVAAALGTTAAELESRLREDGPEAVVQRLPDGHPGLTRVVLLPPRVLRPPRHPAWAHALAMAYQGAAGRANRLRRFLDMGVPEVVLANERHQLQVRLLDLRDALQVAVRTVAGGLWHRRADYTAAGPGAPRPEPQVTVPPTVAVALMRPWLLGALRTEGHATSLAEARDVLRSGGVPERSLLERILADRWVIARTDRLWTVAPLALGPEDVVQVPAALEPGGDVVLHLLLGARAMEEMRRLHGRILPLTDPPDVRGWLEGLLSGDDPLAIDLDDDALGSDLGRLLLTGAP